MKNINRLYASRAFWAMLAACILLLLPGCQNMLQSQDPPGAEVGTVLLTFDRPGAERTVLPEIVPDRFARFDISFAPNADCAAGNSYFSKQGWLPDDSIDLSAGTWDLTLSGFMHCTTNARYLEAAQGRLSGFAVVAGETLTHNVVLYPIAEGGQGTFSWNLGFPASIVSARMEILTMPGGLPSDYGPFYFHGGPGGDSTVGLESHIAMAAGQYRVLFTMTLYKDQGGMETATLATILRVYMNMESRFEQAFSYRHFPFSLNRILASWDGASWDFAREGIAATHFSQLGICGIDDDKLDSVEYWFNRLIPPGPVPSNLEGLESLVDASLVGMAGAYIGAAPHANRLAAQAAILAQLANTDPDKVGFSWRPNGTAVSVNIAAYTVEIVFAAAIGAPRERGTVFVTIGEQNLARTIMPDIGLNDFVRFDLEFLSVCGLGHETQRITWTNPSGSVELYAGTWDLRVSAYLDSGGEDPAAAGSLDGIQVLAGESSPALVFLFPADWGQGTFSWDISFPANIVSARLDIWEIEGDNDAPVYFRHFSNAENARYWESSIGLDAGSYRITFSLTNNLGYEARVSSALHIFGNMVSHFEFSITPELPLGNLITFRGITQPAWINTPIPEGLFEAVGPLYGTNGPDAKWVIDENVRHLTLQQSGRTENWHGIYIIPAGADGLNLLADDVLTIRGRVERLTAGGWSRMELYPTPAMTSELPSSVGKHPFELIWIVGEVPSGNIRVQVNGGADPTFSPTLIIDSITLERFADWEPVFELERVAPVAAGPFVPIGPLGSDGGEVSWVARDGGMSIRQANRTANWEGIDINIGAAPPGLNLQAGDMITIMGRVYAENVYFGGWRRMEINIGGGNHQAVHNINATGMTNFILEWIVAPVGNAIPSGIRIGANGGGTAPAGLSTFYIDSIVIQRPTLATP